MQKNQVELTWCNSHSWWAIGAEGLTGSRSLRRCPLPYWTADGRPHSYQYKSEVKEKDSCKRSELIKKKIYIYIKSTFKPDNMSWSFGCFLFFYMLHILEIVVWFIKNPNTFPLNFLSADRHHCAKPNTDKIPSYPLSLGGAKTV